MDIRVTTTTTVVVGIGMMHQGHANPMISITTGQKYRYHVHDGTIQQGRLGGWR